MHIDFESVLDTVLVEDGIGMEVHESFEQVQNLRDKLNYNRTISVLSRHWKLERKSYFLDSCLISQQRFDIKGRLSQEIYRRQLDGQEYVCQRIYNKKGEFKVITRIGKLNKRDCN